MAERLGKLIDIFSLVERNLKLRHWTTKSHAEHETTEYIVNNLRPLFDKFVEEAIGSRYADTIKLPSKFLEPTIELDLTDFLQQFSEFMQNNEKVAEMTMNSATIDDIVDTINVGIYKLSQN